MMYFDLARTTHIAFGSVALLSFWTVAALPKGTLWHRRLGDTYLLAILGVVITAVPLAFHAFIAGRSAFGIFLLYLVLITGSAAWIALRAIRRRGSWHAYVGGAYRPVACLNLLGGGALLILGIMEAAPLFIGMSTVGLLVGGQMLRFTRKAPTERSWWLKRHYIGIVGSGIATHIGFLNLGLRHLIPAQYAAPTQYLGWFAPLLGGIAAVLWLNRRYGGGLAARAAPRAPAASR